MSEGDVIAYSFSFSLSLSLCQLPVLYFFYRVGVALSTPVQYHIGICSGDKKERMLSGA